MTSHEIMNTQTENGAVAHATTYSSLMDLFIKSVRKCESHYINDMSGKCWDESPELFMKLIYLTRCPRTGKGERDVSFHMLAWLKTYSPNTYILNIEKIAMDYGRINDLLDMALFEIPGIDRDYELKIFAKILKRDLCLERPSLAGKWAPRENKYYDTVKLSNGKAANLTSRLSRILFPGIKNSLRRYRKEILIPLNKKINILETLMCNKQWSDIKYENVPAQAMKIYGRQNVTKKIDGKSTTVTGAFIRHDEERFDEYRSRVKDDKADIKTTGIQPHQLTKEAMHQEDQTIELQWNALVSKLGDIESLGKAIALVDVSGSMSGEPLQVAVALGLIIASLSKGPFKDQMITFSNTPEWHKITGNTLHQKLTNMVRAKWGMNTNIEAVFDLILKLAIDNKVSEENMPKTLFIFTDMEFDTASNCKNEKVLFQEIRDKWTSVGRVMPKLVFWNLRASNTSAFPVTLGEHGVAYLSGFSTELLKIFVEGCEFNPKLILTQLLDKYTVEIDEYESTMSFAELKVLSDIRAKNNKNDTIAVDIDYDPALAEAYKWFEKQGEKSDVKKSQDKIQDKPQDMKNDTKLPQSWTSMLRKSLPVPPPSIPQSENDYDIVSNEN
jgi:hypothetical protein